MKKSVILTVLMTAFLLTSCGTQTSSQEDKPSSNEPTVTSKITKSSSEPESEIPFDPSTLPSNGIALEEGKTVKFEAENAIPTAWKNSGWGGDATFVADDAEANASGGKFVTPSTGNVDANRKFEIVIYAPKAGQVTMQVAYCRGGKNSKTATIDYSYVYQYRIDEVENQFLCTTEDHTDSSVSSWEWRLIEFKVTVKKGLHTIAGYLDSANANTNAGCPCIDYYTFTI